MAYKFRMISDQPVDCGADFETSEHISSNVQILFSRVVLASMHSV